MEQLAVDHDEELMQRDAQHQQDLIDFQERIKSLESDSVDNSDDFRPATDDSLKIKEGFISSPFGLGALSPRDGKKKLLDCYVALLKLHGPEPFTGPMHVTEEESVGVFRTNKVANGWRSATFQSIITDIIPKKGKAVDPLGGDMRRPYIQNREQSPPRHSRRPQERVRQRCVGRDRGDRHQPGERRRRTRARVWDAEGGTGARDAQKGVSGPDRPGLFVDCYDGDTDRGLFKEVVLAVSPRLYKTGDGRGDMKSTKAILHGEIYAARS
ncbi:hypothetical protein MFIFM68171_02978 [Madurella fahalii]|uniref:Uncharacterized protein n=1 Tax=Madurella fahalii TaxID=1157608 RepID=A0ABQ0G4S3_9PEZI